MLLNWWWFLSTYLKVNSLIDISSVPPTKYRFSRSTLQKACVYMWYAYWVSNNIPIFLDLSARHLMPLNLPFNSTKDDFLGLHFFVSLFYFYHKSGSIRFYAKFNNKPFINDQCHGEKYLRRLKIFPLLSSLL